MSATDLLQEKLLLINEALERFFPAGSAAPPVISEAMRYSLYAGGKRIRAILPLMVVESYGQPGSRALACACALEMIHTYSLIHDDLPCMDDDDLRRGKPTNHKVYGEAMALLAGDALLTAGFGCLSQGCQSGDYSPEVMVQLVALLAQASGTGGMVGGQVLDLLGLTPAAERADLEQIHRLKTGALLRTAVLMGAVVAGASTDDMDHWRGFGDALGLAFQIQDDILDVVGDAGKMGKKTGRDEKNKKVTYVTLLGLEGARQALGEEHQKMLIHLQALPVDHSQLEELVGYLLTRDS